MLNQPMARHRGTILLVCLVLLATTTVLAGAGVRRVVLAQRISGLAFAQALVRNAAENQARSLRSLLDRAPPGSGMTGYFPSALPHGADSLYWTDTLDQGSTVPIPCAAAWPFPWLSCAATRVEPGEGDGCHVRWVIELMPVGPGTQESMRVYRVTVRASAKSGAADHMLQFFHWARQGG